MTFQSPSNSTPVGTHLGENTHDLTITIFKGPQEGSPAALRLELGDLLRTSRNDLDVAPCSDSQ